MITVYMITCTANNKSYIGITNNMKRRFAVHFNTNKNTVLARTIKKYGKDNFIIDILDLHGAPFKALHTN